MLILRKYLLVSLFAALTVACGGGGNGTPNIQYTGKTNAATITSANASTLGTKSLSAQNDASKTTATRSIVPQSAIDIARGIALGQVTTVQATRATQSSGPQPGTCGGSYTANSDGGTGGALVFSSYCTGTLGAAGPSVTINGSIGFSAILATDTYGQQYVSTLNLTYTYLTVTTQPGNVTFSSSGTFTFAMDPAAAVLSVTESTVIEDASGKMVWLDNYVVANTPTGVTINGRIYLSDEGYVDIQTTTPFAVISGQWPTSGQLVLTGANGVKVRLTANSSGYTIEIAPDGINYGAPSAAPWPV